MMEKEFNLSDQEMRSGRSNSYLYYRKADIKEFIKRLKEQIILLMGAENVNEREEALLDCVKEIINKLIGDKLI